MAFELRAGESVAKGIRRVTRREIDKARDQLAGQTQASTDERVHATRKRIKKIRSVMRLVRDDLGGKVYRRESSLFRDVSRPLSEVRDAHALLLAVDKLREGHQQEVPPAAWSAVLKALEKHEQEVSREVLQGGAKLDELLTSIQDARRRVKTWTLTRTGFSALRSGLKSAYRRGRRAFVTAFAEPTDKNLHECRKRIQDLRHHLALLQPVRPALLSELTDQAHELSDQLGHDHDLAVLRGMLASSPSPLGTDTDGLALLPVIDRRREELRQAARAAGEQIFRDNPRDFVWRINAFWHLWRWETKLARREGKEAQFEAEREEGRRQRGEARQERQTLEERLRDVRAECRQAEEELEHARADLEEAKREHQEEVRRQLNEASQERESLERSLRELREEYQQSMEDLRKARADLEDVQRERQEA